MKTYLVTGGAGFIGANFIKYLLKEYKNDINIIVLDKLTYAGNLKTLESELNKIEFIKGDVCDSRLVEDIFSKNKVDYVVHFAAESHVDRSIENPQLFLQTNILGTQNLLDCSMRSWMIHDDEYRKDVKFLQISTDEVYGSLGDVGYFTEDTSLSPRSPYSASKASADLLVLSYVNTYRFPANITRCSNNYGPYHFPEKLIPLIINNILKGLDLPVYGDGKNVRDWIYVGDHCRAIDMVLCKGELGHVYNVGGGNEKQNIEIVKAIIDIVRELVEDNFELINTLKIDRRKINYNLIKYVRDRKGHDKRYAVDYSKIRDSLGWYPKTNFEDGLLETIKWYLKNQNWIEDVLAGDYQEYYERIYKGR